MDELDFFLVDAAYVLHLKQCENAARGFSRVPNVEYGQGRKPKFLCGVVLRVNGFDYFVPVSSYKLKQPDNFVIKVNSKIVSSLRFNYMIPCPTNVLSVRKIKTEPDAKYRWLLSRELDYCRLQQDRIRNLAERTYLRVTKRLDPNLVKNSCDFRLLEQACLLYTEKSQSHQQPPLSSFSDRLHSAQSKAAALNAQRQTPQVPGKDVPTK